MELDNDFINKLIKEDDARQAEPTRRGGGHKKPDPTEIREINVWQRLQHHLCMSDCEHRTAETNPTGRACWNPECVDPRDHDDRGTCVVSPVKDVFMCRYCFLDGWKL